MADTTSDRSGYTFGNAWKQAREPLALLETVRHPDRRRIKAARQDRRSATPGRDTMAPSFISSTSEAWHGR